ncbi:ABC transporter substrate-binding protein [Gulbenkiania mobilis]|uniref:Branched-chain amino acid transport system substrate-binding protein n=1 Tax=Gulbenkiania mobilis TaxID=397457 RepID=A0ABY2CXA9_GULMO|nr:branched-chain amino acid transport system substrate-binding protein [Gulbenkiania mobilis]
MGRLKRSVLRVALWLVACGALAGPVPIRIGVQAALTGGSSPMGVSMRNGIQLAVEEINASGGLLGRPLQLVERDDAGSPQQGVRAAEELVRLGRVVAVVGLVNSGVALASQPVYQAARLPVMIAVATVPELTRRYAGSTRNYMFRVAAADDLQAPLIVREALSAGYRRLAIFSDTTDYGREGAEGLVRALRQQGLRPVYQARFSLGERDMTGALAAARSTGAEAILTYAIGPELAAVANDADRLDWKVPLIGSWTLSMSNFIDNAGPNAEGARMVQSFLQDTHTPRGQAFVQAYLGRYHVRRIPSPVSAAQGYDAMLLLAAAIRQAGSTAPTAVVAALENLRQPVEGAITTYLRPFTSGDHEAIELSVPTIGRIEHGRIVPARMH